MDILTTAYLPARGEMPKKCADRPAVGTLVGVFGFFMTFFHRAAHRSPFRTDLQI